MDPAEIRATADAVARDPDFWLDPTNEYVWLEELDAGASFHSLHKPDRELTTTVISNSTDGASPILRALQPRPTA